MTETVADVAELDSTAAVHEIAGNKATARVLRVLHAFSGEVGSLGVTEVSQRFAMTKSMAHRALTTLLEHGYLVRDTSGGRYELGLHVLRLYPRNARAPELGELAAEAIQRMHELTGETVTLNVQAGRNALTIDGKVGEGPIARSVPLGRATPMHANAAGRAILAHIDDAELGRYFAEPLETFTATTLSRPAEVRAEVQLVRSRGYALGYQDHAPNAAGVAFPMLDRSGRPWGSISVAGPIERLTAERLTALIPPLTEIAATLNRRTRLYTAPVAGRE